MRLEQTFNKIALLVLFCASPLSSIAADIDSNIPSGIPTYIDGANDAEARWTEIGVKMLAEVECVDLKPVGVCPDEEILWSFRLPVQLIENVRNVGETMLEMPFENVIDYADYENFYSDVQSYVSSQGASAASVISIASNQQRRSGLRPGLKQRISFGQSHVFGTDDDYSPAILDFLPDICTSWDKNDPFKTDVYPNQVLWRMPEFTAQAQIGADQVSPADCAIYDMATGKSNSNLIDLSSSLSIGTALAAQTCASAWGGKIFPLNGQTYSPNVYVGDALRTLKAIELGPYAKTMPQYQGGDTYSFDKSEDVLKDYYNDSGCIAFGDKAQSGVFPKENASDEQITHYVHFKRYYCCD